MPPFQISLGSAYQYSVFFWALSFIGLRTVTCFIVVFGAPSCTLIAIVGRAIILPYFSLNYSVECGIAYYLFVCL